MENKKDKIKITLATSNAHKVQEINLIAQEKGCNNFEFVLPQGDFDPVEDGDTFLENAYCKAKCASENGTTNLYLADDSGLCVDALSGAPGIKSARYAPSAQERIDKLLKNLQGIENRNAKFVCAMVICDKEGKILFQAQKECLGSILKEQKGKGGFGYDPVFLLKDKDVSMAQLTSKEKANVSHRSKALASILDWLKKTYD